MPIGLINDSWGGSACEAWIRRDLLAADPKYCPLLERWEKIEKNYAEAKAETSEGRGREGQGRGQASRQAAQNPDGQMRGNARPGNIYNGVLKPTIGYGIRGAIWYQGESNASRAYQYRDLFPLMIQSWRDEWGSGDFPFYWVQLADFMAEKPEPRRERLGRAPRGADDDHEQAAQDRRGRDHRPRRGQGHPPQEQAGRRQAARPLGPGQATTASRSPYQSPTYKSMEKQGNKIVLTFDHVGGGLQPFDVAEPRGFAIAGSDQQVRLGRGARSSARTRSRSGRTRSSEPVAVRYAWADNPVCNLYSREGLPATPFRTDDWPGVTVNNDK